MDESYDVTILGGGPIGNYVAFNIAEKKYQVAVLEEHKEIGKPVKCAGLISQRVFDFLDIDKKKVIQNKIYGAHIYSPSGQNLTIGGDKIHALVINRLSFDKEIFKKSKNKGVNFYLNNKVVSIQRINNQIELKTSQDNEIQSKLLIGADGPYSKTRDLFSLSKPTEFLRGIGAEIEDTDINPKYVKIFVGRKIAPDFFSWIIPTNNKGTQARVGLCIGQDIKNSPNYYFKKLFENPITKQHLEKTKIIKKMAGNIPIGFLKKTYDSNVMIVGDAAAQVKPTSGGGIYTGLLCGRHCSTIATKSLENYNFDLQFLRKYQALWMADIGRELNIGIMFRRLFKKLNDKQINKYIEKFKNSKVNEAINNYGDIDYPSKLVKPLIKRMPSLIKLLPSLIRNI